MTVKFPIIYFFSSNFIFPPFNIKPSVERMPPTYTCFKRSRCKCRHRRIQMNKPLHNLGVRPVALDRGSIWCSINCPRPKLHAFDQFNDLIVNI